MKRFLLRLLAFTLIPIGIYAYFIFLLPVHEEVYIQAYKQKCQLLKDTPTPRIILTGGSNLAFGVDSKRIADSLGIPVINVALHAGIGLKFIIDDLSNRIQNGDIIVVAPEYNHFDGNAYGEGLTLPVLLKAANWENLQLLNLKQWRVVLTGIPELRHYAKAPKIGHKSTYFNDLGDEVHHLNEPNAEIPATTYPQPPIDEEFCHYFVEKLRMLEAEKECTVILTPPACRETFYNGYKGNIEKISNQLSTLGRPFNVTPYEHVTPDSCAFDTDYHLNKQGVDIFTSKLIAELKAHINK